MITEKNKIKFGLADLEAIRGPITFARLLLSYRNSVDISQVNLAKKLDLSQANLCDFEKGRKIPSASKAEKMARKLKEIPQYWVQIAVQDMLRAQDLDYIVRIERKSKAA